MSKAKIWAVIFLVFVLGVMAGSLGMQQYMHHKVADFFKRGGKARVEILLARMTRDFDLTDSQQVSVKKILLESHKKIEKIKRETDPQIKSIIDDSLRHIRENLTDNQKKRFDDHQERVKKREVHPLPF
jgi:hypothetical protein